jgi:UDP-glucose 6-dehydrogenase
MKIGIIGYGFVGQAQHSIINETAEVMVHDIKHPYIRSLCDLTKNDIIFICVPTPIAKSGGQDASIVVELLEKIESHDYTGTVVIKSTVLSKHLEKFSETLNICFNPEFLNQNTSFEDAKTQKTIILGGDIKNTKVVEKFYREHTTLFEKDAFRFKNEEPQFEFMTIKEACDFKYTRNLYGAYKVLFWEFIQDTTGNSRKMAELYEKTKYNNEMSQVGMDGERGFGGACFPKDTDAWDKEHNHQLTKFMLEFNSTLK